MRRLQARPGRPRRRQFPQRPPGQDGNHRGRAGGNLGATGPGSQLRPENRHQEAAAADRGRRGRRHGDFGERNILEEATAAGSRPAPVNRGDLSRRRPGMGRGRRDQALRRRLAVPWAAHRSARPRQAERPPAAGNPLPRRAPFLGLHAPPGSPGRLLQLAEPPHPRRVTPRGGKQQRIRDDLAVRSPDSSREILRATGVDQHLRTSAPCRTVRLPRHVPDLPTGELPLKLAPALTVLHRLCPPSTLNKHTHPRP